LRRSTSDPTSVERTQALPDEHPAGARGDLDAGKHEVSPQHLS
jgi:hypothetical protein